MIELVQMPFSTRGMAICTVMSTGVPLGVLNRTAGMTEVVPLWVIVRVFEMGLQVPSRVAVIETSVAGDVEPPRS